MAHSCDEIAILCWIGSHQALAAWMQAIFSVVAIAIAAAIPTNVWKAQLREKRKKRDAQTISLELALISPFFLLTHSFKIAMSQIELAESKHLTYEEWKSHLGVFVIKIPEHLYSYLQNSYLLENGLRKLIFQSLISAEVANANFGFQSHQTNTALLEESLRQMTNTILATGTRNAELVSNTLSNRYLDTSLSPTYRP
jgi:hypothetical protein